MVLPCSSIMPFNPTMVLLNPAMVVAWFKTSCRSASTVLTKVAIVLFIAALSPSFDNDK